MENRPSCTKTNIRLSDSAACSCHTLWSHEALARTASGSCFCHLSPAGDAAFVLVAGGLGERLGYSGIKVGGRLHAKLAGVAQYCETWTGSVLCCWS